MKVVMHNSEDIFDEDAPLREIRNRYMTINSIDRGDSILEKYADRDRVKLMEQKYTTCGLLEIIKSIMEATYIITTV